MTTAAAILSSRAIRAALRLAWRQSRPGPAGAHEEGGFIVGDRTGALRVVRWPRGQRNAIEVPPHLGCRIHEFDLLASFHTHPNTGPGHLQEPSETDRRAVREDPDLKAPHFAGELVISARVLYLVSPDGSVSEIGETEAILGQT